MNEPKFADLVGQTLTGCRNVGGERIIFEIAGRDAFILYHLENCCESVRVHDICGDLKDLVGSPIVQAEESSNNDMPADVKLEYQAESMTWTFYRIATAKGQVVIRWLGESNGYYSESVDFERITQ